MFGEAYIGDYGIAIQEVYELRGKADEGGIDHTRGDIVMSKTSGYKLR